MVVVAAIFGLRVGVRDGGFLHAGTFPDFIDERVLNNEKTLSAPRPRNLPDAGPSHVTRAETALASALVAALAILALLVLVRLVSMLWATIRLHGFRLTAKVETSAPLPAADTRRGDDPAASHPDADAARRPVAPAGRPHLGARRHGGRRSRTNAPPDRHWLAPIVERRALTALMAQVMPVLSMDRLEKWQPVHPGARRRLLKESLIFSAVACLPLVGNVR